MSEIRLPLQAMRANAERKLERWEEARCIAEDSSSCERCSSVAAARWVLRITDLFPDVRGVDQLLRIELVDPPGDTGWTLPTRQTCARCVRRVFPDTSSSGVS